MAKKPNMMIHRRSMPVRLTRTGWEYETQEREVRVMVEAEGYAMVRLKGCLPFVVPSKELHAKGKDHE